MPIVMPFLARLSPLLVAFPLLSNAQAWTDPQQAPSASPQPVSPGAAETSRLIAESCPTFSWGAVDGAQRYELVFYDAQWNPSADAEEQATSGEPLQQIAIDAPATAWTSSGELCLDDGAGYVWFVRAETADGLGPWSEGARFEIDYGIDALSEAVRRELAVQLKQPEVWREVIQQALASDTGLRLTERAAQTLSSTPAATDDARALSATAGSSLTATSAIAPQATSYPNPSAFKTSGPNGVVFGGTFGEGGIPAEGEGTRLMWYPGKAAFRAGRVLGVEGQWDDTNVGI